LAQNPNTQNPNPQSPIPMFIREKIKIKKLIKIIFIQI